MDLLIITTILISITNIFSVWFAAKNDRSTWSIGFFAAAATAIIFYMNQHFLSFAFNTYSAIICVIGFFKWSKSVEENDANIKFCEKPFIYHGLALTIFFVLAMVNIHISQDSLLDAAGTSLSIVAAYLLVKHDIMAWIMYIISDLIYIVLGILSNNFEYIIIYSILLIIAIYGTYQYIVKYKNNLKCTTEH